MLISLPMYIMKIIQFRTEFTYYAALRKITLVSYE